MPGQKTSLAERQLQMRARHLLQTGGPIATAAGGIERHYRVRELVELLGLSDRSVRRRVHALPGVVVFGRDRSRSKRRYRTVLVPESVVRQMLLEFTTGC